MRNEINKILSENKLDSSQYDISELYDAGMRFIHRNIDVYFDKNYPINTVLRSLFIEGIVTHIKNNGKTKFDMLVEEKTREIKEESRKISQRSIEIKEESRRIFEKNKEINDSIKYAKSLQNSVLPPISKIKKYLEQYFIFFKPKDIIGGDFYWFEEKDDYLYFSVSDCTGHGVPGGMVSLICSSALNKSLNELHITSTNGILDKTRDIVVDTFNRNGEDINDGMDMALCKLDIENNKLYFSGANRPLWIVRDGILIEYKSDKQPVGRYFESKPFTCNEIDLFKNDMIYLSSDGYGDQFGGDRDSKFKTAKFKQILIDYSVLNMIDQSNRIEKSFLDWKGETDQTDDICVFGVRI